MKIPQFCVKCLNGMRRRALRDRDSHFDGEFDVVKRVVPRPRSGSNYPNIPYFGSVLYLFSSLWIES